MTGNDGDGIEKVWNSVSGNIVLWMFCNAGCSVGELKTSSNRGRVRLRQKDDEVEWYNLLKES